jgi:hypothetical protein
LPRSRALRAIHISSRAYVYPKLGSKKFLDIRRKTVTELLDWIKDNHSAAMADTLHDLRRTCPVAAGFPAQKSICLLLQLGFALAETVERRWRSGQVFLRRVLFRTPPAQIAL